MILFSIFWFSAILYWDVITDYDRWLKVEINHGKESIIRAALLIPSTLLLSFPDFSIWKMLAAILLQVSLYWELFDGFYNNKRRFHWRFNGSIDPNDSKLDIFLRKLSPSQQTYLKWGLILTSLTSYIILWQQ